MGFLSPKAVCAVCGKDCGLKRFQLANKEWVCPSCFKAAGFNMATPIRTMTADSVKQAIAARNADSDKLSTFNATKQVPGMLCVDENPTLWYTPLGVGG